jgi:hypothetical protein
MDLTEKGSKAKAATIQRQNESEMGGILSWIPLATIKFPDQNNTTKSNNRYGI